MSERFQAPEFINGREVSCISFSGFTHKLGSYKCWIGEKRIDFTDGGLMRQQIFAVEDVEIPVRELIRLLVKARTE